MRYQKNMKKFCFFEFNFKFFKQKRKEKSYEKFIQIHPH